MTTKFRQKFNPIEGRFNLVTESSLNFRVANTFVAGDIVRQSAPGSFVLALADANTNISSYVIESASGTEFALAERASVLPLRNETTITFAADDPVYLSASEPGKVTNVQPALGDFVVPIGRALSATEFDYTGVVGFNTI